MPEGVWAKIIRSVTNPLGFLVLIVLVGAFSLIGHASLSNVKPLYFFSVLGLLVFLIIIVVLFAWFRPGVLEGKRHEQITAEVAKTLAIDVYSVVDGYIEESAKGEAYAMLHDACMSRSDSEKGPTHDFVKMFVTTIKERAAIFGKAKAKGHLETPSA